ncbi:MAG: ral secretion pathway protein GspG [Nitrospirae bacterium]|nr:ral secretion pathway protein GspG [Nitrospirota bacterium]
MMDKRGLTLIEMLVVIAIVSILAAAVMPLSRMTVKRVKEIELRSGLRTIRSAIDAFRKDCEPAAKKLSTDYCKADQDYYPESLEQLTQPLKLAGTGDKTRKYLRRIPRDPMMTSSYDGETCTTCIRRARQLPLTGRSTVRGESRSERAPRSVFAGLASD